MGRGKGMGVRGAVCEQIEYLRRASRSNAWGIKVQQNEDALNIFGRAAVLSVCCLFLFFRCVLLPFLFGRVACVRDA